ncbi:MAG: hypothetical protein OSJ43_01330 [Oscillospiraceae bacterium]|nr:hypothetical protein [Oscillospiraceae bacterium]
MPDIYDPERGLKIGLTDDDYEDYQKGNLSDDFYARRTDGSIANRVDISPLDDDNDCDEDRYPTDGIDAGSAAVGGLIAVAIIGIGYGIKKLWDRHKAKKAEAQIAEQQKAQADLQEDKNTQTAIEPSSTVLSTEAAEAKDSERKSLTQDEAIQELMKIIVGMSEIADGKKKVSEGVETLSNAGIVDRAVLLEKLSDPKVLEGFNAYLQNNPHIVMQNQTILSGIFGRTLTADGQYIPLAAADIERQLNAETIQED